MPKCPNCESDEFKFGVCTDCRFMNDGDGDYQCVECGMHLSEEPAKEHKHDDVIELSA